MQVGENWAAALGAAEPRQVAALSGKFLCPHQVARQKLFPDAWHTVSGLCHPGLF